MPDLCEQKQIQCSGLICTLVISHYNFTEIYHSVSETLHTM